MIHLQEGMKIRRNPNAVSRSWWTRGKEYKVFESKHDGVEDFYILDDDGEFYCFDFDGESFRRNAEIIGNFSVVEELYEEPQKAPSGFHLKNTRKAIRRIENELIKVEGSIGYGYYEDRETRERDYLKRDLLNIQLNCMNAIIKDLGELK